MKRFTYVLFLALMLVVEAYADIASDLEALADGNQVKVVWAHNRNGSSFQMPPVHVSTVFVLGFDSRKGTIDTICNTLGAYARPLITYDGSQIVYTDPVANTVHIVNWDGTAKRTVAQGRAGCLWYDTVNDREYVYYGTSCSAGNCESDIMRIDIHNLAAQPEVVLEPAAAAYTKVVGEWLNISGDGKMLGGIFPWPSGRVYDLTTGQRDVSRSAGGCWSSMAYDDKYRFLILNDNHSGVQVDAGQTTVPVLYFCPSGTPGCGDQFDMAKMASYNPEYMTFINEGEDGSGVQGPGLVVVARVNADISAFVGRVTIGNMETDPLHAGPSDVWIGTSAGPTEKQLGLTVPNGAEAWKPDETYTITWTSSGEIANVAIELSTDNGATWQSLGNTANTGSFSVAMPASANSEQCLVRITDASDNTVKDVSNAVFSIKEAVQVAGITLLAPIGGEEWEVGTTETVSWESEASVTAVVVELSTDNGSTWSNMGIASGTGSREITVPDQVSTTCLVRIRVPGSETIFAMNEAPFTIKVKEPVVGIEVLVPNGGETWRPGESYTVSWESQPGIAKVVVSISLNGGSTYPTSATINNTGSFNWTVPASLNSPTCRIKISAEQDATMFDTSEANFSIGTTSTVAVAQAVGPVSGVQVAGYNNSGLILSAFSAKSTPLVVTAYTFAGRTAGSVRTTLSGGVPVHVHLPLAAKSAGSFVVRFRMGDTEYSQIVKGNR